MHLLEALDDEDRDAVVRFVWSQYKPAPVDKTAADRVRRHRERKKAEDVTRNVTDDVTEGVTEDLSRYNQIDRQTETKTETKTAKAPRKKSAPVEIPESLDTPDFLAAWDEWQAERKERGKKLTARAMRGQLGSLEKMGPARAVESIRASIANGWTGLFEPRATGSGKVGHVSKLVDVGPSRQVSIAELKA